MPIQWPSRILKRAASIPGGTVLLEIAERPHVPDDMRSIILDGGKPVEALSDHLVEALGLEAARLDSLRQLAGEATAHIAETLLSAVRSSGSRVIKGNPVFASGTPYKLPGQLKGTAASEPMATELLVRHLSDGALRDLSAMIEAEIARRRK